MIKELIEKRGLSIYSLSKKSEIPYSTLLDLVKGKRSLEKCNAETVYKLSKTLKISMEELLEPYMHKRCDFELFKSNVCHKLKHLGDVDFVIDTLENNVIREYYNRRWYPESLYMLAMLDYVSRINDIPFCNEYNDLRKMSLKEEIYSVGVVLMSEIEGNDNAKLKAKSEAIPEFARFNIIESDVRNVF